MTNKLSQHNSVFLSGKFIEVSKTRIYKTFTIGQTHYVFVHNKILFRLSFETSNGQGFLQEYLKLIS